jgi:XTP/dITP diphosphohydrolase
MKKRFPSFLDFFKVLGLFIIFQIPFSGLFLVFKKYEMLFVFLSYVLSMLMVIWVTRQLFNRKSRLNFKPSDLKLLPLVIITTYAFFLFGNLLLSLLPEPSGIFKKMFEMMNETVSKIMKSPVYGFLLLAVAAPLLEETLFRGIFLKALLKKYKPWKAIIISAVFFGIFHLNPWQFLYATVLGIWLGYMFWKTGSLFYPVLIHFLANGTAFVLAQIYGTDYENDPFTQSDLLPVLFVMGLSWLVIRLSYGYLEKYFAGTKKPVVLATQNSHKIAEIQKILPDSFVLRSLQDIGFEGKLRETGDTLKKNAIQKMRQIAIPYDVDALADDTGLEVEALNGAPGVYSARYAGENAAYKDNVEKLLSELQDVENRKAQFKTVMALSLGDEEFIVEGVIKGAITTEPKGEGGFGYDSVFVPEGYTQTFAEMGDEQKNKISHRAIALQKLKEIFN